MAAPVLIEAAQFVKEKKAEQAQKLLNVGVLLLLSQFYNFSQKSLIFWMDWFYSYRYVFQNWKVLLKWISLCTYIWFLCKKNYTCIVYNTLFIHLHAVWICCDRIIWILVCHLKKYKTILGITHFRFSWSWLGITFTLWISNTDEILIFFYISTGLCSHPPWQGPDHQTGDGPAVPDPGSCVRGLWVTQGPGGSPVQARSGKSKLEPSFYLTVNALEICLGQI